MSDLISRQGAIDFFLKKGMITSAIYVERMPSAQPSFSCDHEKDHIAEVSKMDCISRQAALDVLEERLQANGYSNVALVSEFNRSIGYLRRLSSAQPEQRWIPCKERMPYIDGEYLITKKCFGWGCKKYYKPDIAWYGKSGWNKADEVIAWCELPEPWKEGEAE